MRLHVAEVALVGVLIAGCSGEEGGTTAPPAEPSGTQTSLTAEDTALEAYEQMWGVLVDEARNQEPDYSSLQDYATGDALALVEHGVFAEADEGVVARGAPVLSPEVISKEDSRIEIEDCMDSSDWLREDGQTGDLVEPSPGEPIRRKIDASVTFDGLSWKVAELQIWETGSCDA